MKILKLVSMASRLSFFAAAIFCMSFNTYAASSQECKTLAESIEVTFPQGVPDTVNADSNIEIPVKVKVADQELLKPFVDASVLFSLSNNQIGSASPNDSFFVKQSEEGESIKEDFVFKAHIHSGSFGIYKFTADIIFYGEDGFCTGTVKKIPVHQIFVQNKFEDIDTYAPIVSSLSFKNPSEILESVMEVKFRIIDKNELCTQELIDLKQCEGVFHVALLEVHSGKEIDIYPKTFKDQDGSYKFSIELLSATGFQKGSTYKIKGINVSDILGNSMHHIRESVQKTFSVE